MSTWTIVLPYSRPPLTLNGGHGNVWHIMRIKRDLRGAGRDAAVGIPALGRARITMEYQPRDKRRRDATNTIPTLKSLVDGVVDAGVLPDDDDAHCEQIPRILPKGPAFNDRGHRLRLVIEEIR